MDRLQTTETFPLSRRKFVERVLTGFADSFGATLGKGAAAVLLGLVVGAFVLLTGFNPW